MQLLDPSKPHRLEIGAAVYWLRVPRLVDRAAYRRAIVADGGRKHTPLGMLQTIKRGIEAMAEAAGDPPPKDAIAVVEAQIGRLTDLALRARAGEFDGEEGIETFTEAVGEIDRGGEALQGIESIVRQHWPAYREMLADNEAYPEIEALAAARMFVIGWEGVEGLTDRKPKPFALIRPDFVYQRGPGGTPDEVLAAIPPDDLGRIRDEVDALLSPSKAEVKNSASPRSGPAAARNSKGTSTPPRTTRSSATAGSSPS